MSFDTFKSNTANWLRTNKPALLTGTGLVLMVGGTVASCFATIKVKAIYDEANLELKAVNNTLKNPSTNDEAKARYKRAARNIILKAIGKIAAYYSLGAGLTGAGIACICGGSKEYKSRLGSAAAYTASLSALLAKYKDELVKLDKGADEKIRIGAIEKQKKEITSTDITTGELVTKEEEITIVDPNFMGSPYAFYFDATTSDDFVDNKDLPEDVKVEISLKILDAKQSHFNDLLKAKNAASKHKEPIWYCDVLKDIGMKHDGVPRYDKNGNIISYDTDVAQVTGWVYEPDNPNVSSFIDLRARRVFIERDGTLVPTIVCDPNVDGSIIGYKYKGGNK